MTIQQMINPRTGKTPRWGMTVDLNRCVGCQTCTIACKHANDTEPGVQWRRVLDIETGTFPSVERLFLVTGCQHCAEPSCVPVCPTGATKQREDGLVTMDYDICIGCGYCAVSCPYQARTIVHDKSWYYGKETKQEKQVEHKDRIGVAQKCSFCIERIDESYEEHTQPGVDLDYTPACAASCIAQALVFGDFNDEDSKVSRLIADKPSFQMQDHLGNDPQVKYLYETPTVPGRAPNDNDMDDERLSDPENPLVGVRQQYWDMRAAMNFGLGGMSSGLGFVTLLAWFAGYLDGAAMHQILIGSAILMAVGLFSVFLEIGRKLRFANALQRPQTSWMTREVYVVGVYYPAIAAWFLWPQAWLLIVAGLAALAFLYSQARILQAAKGIPAWRLPMMIRMLVATGLYEGTGLYALTSVFMPERVTFGPGLAVFALLMAAVNAGLWYQYRKNAKANGIPPLARAVINNISPLLHIGGHFLPAIFIAGSLFWPAMPGWVPGISGALIVGGGFFWKASIITRACYQQGFALNRFPQRGSGKLAAPVRLQGFTSKIS